MCFVVIFLSGCNLCLLLGQAYTIPKAFGLYFKSPSSSFGLATPYSIWEHQNFPFNICLREFVYVVFGLWVRGKKIWNLEWERKKIWAMGKRERRKKKKKEREIWCGEESKSGPWVRQNNLIFGVWKTKI